MLPAIKMRDAMSVSWLAIALNVSALGLSVPGLAANVLAEEPKKEAAEKVGEGNTTRWLEFYRRERGEGWESKPDIGNTGKGARPGAPQEQPPADPFAAPEKR